jgi:16S rRNA (guanine966-N2)-methyltransferase
MKSRRANSPSATGNGGRKSVRIVGGRWRGRRIAFPDSDGLRPTPDRVRETLFNWLQAVVPGARCLDLFAGSGALGFEALSRGATAAMFIERHLHIGQQLRATATSLAATGARIVVADAIDWLRTSPAQPFDVVFLDPPYASGVLTQVCELLNAKAWLAAEASIYLEAPADVPMSFLPATWRILRSKRAGQVGYHLARVATPAAT